MFRRRPDPELLDLFDECGRNAEYASRVLRDLLAGFPEDARQAQDLVRCEHEGERLAHDILRRFAKHHPRRNTLDSSDVHALVGALDDIVDTPRRRRPGSLSTGWRRRWSRPSKSPRCS